MTYAAINLFVLAALLEIGARVVYPWVRGGGFSWEDARARLKGNTTSDAVVAGDPRATAGGAPQVILHPYLGYVFAPGSATVTRDGEELRYSALGFFGDEPILKPGDDEIIVAIGGGSVAAGLWHRGGDALRAALQTHPAFAGKRIRLQSFALGGYKQPQLLYALVYLLSMGAHIDVWIELDGFNEIALPLAENAPAGVPAMYPRNWQRLSQAGTSPGELAVRARLFAAQARRERWRAEIADGPWSRSAFVLACWNEIDRRSADTIATLVASFAPKAEPATTASDDTVLIESVAIWKEASRQMARMCFANGIHYVQFIQPNQYFPGTKPLSEEEQRTAIAQGGYRPPAEKGYARLVQAGEELRAEGLPIVDLTPIFKDEPRTVYRDTCCHLNELGNELLVERIAAAVLESLAEPPQ